MSYINFYTKLLGQRSAGNPPAALDVAGTGDVLSSNAPVFDPTCERLRVQFPRSTLRILHCKTKTQATQMLDLLAERLRDCGLELHPEKTRIVLCKDSKRRGTHDHVQFDFLGYTFRPRRIIDGLGRVRTGFTPAVSRQSMTAMRQRVRYWRLQLKSSLSIDELAKVMAPRVRGWINYYCRFRGSEFQPVADHLDRIIVRWAMRKFKRLRGHKLRAVAWLEKVKGDRPKLFVHWTGNGSFSVGAMGAR